MSTYNYVVIAGRLGKDPELQHTPDGKPYCRLSVATDHSYTKDNGEKTKVTEWHNVVLWAKQAENVAQHLSKGSLALFEGSLRTRSWDDPATGARRYMTEIAARRVVFLGSKSDLVGTQPAVSAADAAPDDDPAPASDTDDTAPF